jgi:hypothetical protein
MQVKGVISLVVLAFTLILIPAGMVQAKTRNPLAVRGVNSHANGWHDFDEDKTVDYIDGEIMASHFASRNGRFDITKDHYIGIDDIVTWAENRNNYPSFYGPQGFRMAVTWRGYDQQGHSIALIWTGVYEGPKR